VVIAGLARRIAVLAVYRLRSGSAGRSRSTTMWSSPNASAISRVAFSTAGSDDHCQ